MQTDQEHPQEIVDRGPGQSRAFSRWEASSAPRSSRGKAFQPPSSPPQTCFPWGCRTGNYCQAAWPWGFAVGAVAQVKGVGEGFPSSVGHSAGWLPPDSEPPNSLHPGGQGSRVNLIGMKSRCAVLLSLLEAVGEHLFSCFFQLPKAAGKEQGSSPCPVIAR